MDTINPISQYPAFLFPVLLAGVGGVTNSCQSREFPMPNVVFVLADEWRAQDTGFYGNKDVKTPFLDKLAGESISLTNAISGCPVCSPYRASLLTGQYPLTNGVFVNDVLLDPEAVTMAKIFNAKGYETAYIGKWHLDGHGRSNFIPRERRQGFSYWKVLECTHNYNNSWYWDNADQKKKWEGYDAFAQTEDAISFIKEKRNSDAPFALVLSWGPPHTPFETAPEEYKQLYREMQLKIRENVPDQKLDKTITDLIGYYAHISALDRCIGELQKAIEDAGIAKNTIFIFTSDHGHMVNSHGLYDKQKPYEESILVPFLIKYPRLFDQGRKLDMLINTPDILPTLLGLCGISIPESIQGADLSPVLRGEEPDETEAVLISCPHPFGQWKRERGGREYRGVRTKQYTYAAGLQGPWLLFDNLNDPFQLNNLIDHPDFLPLREKLHSQMLGLLESTNDRFLPGMDYIRQWGYVVDESETIPYNKINFRGLPIESEK